MQSPLKSRSIRLPIFLSSNLITNIYVISSAKNYNTINPLQLIYKVIQPLRRSHNRSRGFLLNPPPLKSLLGAFSFQKYKIPLSEGHNGRESDWQWINRGCLMKRWILPHREEDSVCLLGRNQRLSQSSKGGWILKIQCAPGKDFLIFSTNILLILQHDRTLETTSDRSVDGTGLCSYIYYLPTYCRNNKRSCHLLDSSGSGAKVSEPRWLHQLAVLPLAVQKSRSAEWLVESSSRRADINQWHRSIISFGWLLQVLTTHLPTAIGSFV